MICACLVSFFAYAIPTSLNIHGIFLFTCVGPFFLCNFMPEMCGCTRTEMVVNTLRNPSTRAGAARTPATHYIILRVQSAQN